MSEMVERVARAIATADERNGGPPFEYRISAGRHTKEALFDQARAAIAAMREPTPDIINAHQVVPDDTDFDERAARNWRCMIDAALGVQS